MAKKDSQPHVVLDAYQDEIIGAAVSRGGFGTKPALLRQGGVKLARETLRGTDPAELARIDRKHGFAGE